MAKNKLVIYCEKGCGEHVDILCRSLNERSEEIIRYRGWRCGEHRAHLTKDALDGANCPVCGEPKVAAALHEFCYPPEPAPQVI